MTLSARDLALFSCSACHRDVADAEIHVGFVLTDCGHILCSSCLGKKPSPSCKFCKAPNVACLPLDADMAEDMASLFAPAVPMLDQLRSTISVRCSTRGRTDDQFQLERLADDVRFFKSMSQKQQAALNDLKPQIEQARALEHEMSQLRSAHDALQRENEDLRSQVARLSAAQSTKNPSMLSDLVDAPKRRATADNPAKRRAVADDSTQLPTSGAVRPSQFSFSAGSRAPTPARGFTLSASQAEHFARPAEPRAQSPSPFRFGSAPPSEKSSDTSPHFDQRTSHDPFAVPARPPSRLQMPPPPLPIRPTPVRPPSNSRGVGAMAGSSFVPQTPTRHSFTPSALPSRSTTPLSSFRATTPGQGSSARRPFVPGASSTAAVDADPPQRPR